MGGKPLLAPMVGEPTGNGTRVVQTALGQEQHASSLALKTQSAMARERPAILLGVREKLRAM